MAGMTRRRAGATSVTILLTAAVLAVVGVGSYIFGRDILGEQYLKPRASPLVPQGTTAGPPTAEVVPHNPPLLGSDPFAFLGKRKPAPARSEATPPPVVSGPAGQGSEGSPKPSKPRRYTIQIGVYLDEQNSRLRQEDLRNRGYSSRVAEGEASGRTVHKVQMGPYSSQEDARRMADELRAQGYSVDVIPQG